jgi:hypothetical protein
MLMRQQGLHNAEAVYVVSEEDEWTIVSPEQIHVRSELTLKKFPDVYEDLVVRLPLRDATMDAVKLGESDLPFEPVEGDQYRVDLTSHQDAARSGTISVRWICPAATITRSETRRCTIPVKPLAPAIAFSLIVTIAETSGFRFSQRNGDARTRRVFTWNSSAYGTPVNELGTWNGLAREGVKDR